MIRIAHLPADERKELFHNTAARMGLSDAIIEKDFWVCLTLDYLFHRSPWRHMITFKGGTSLSKGYHLIKRFSEDIDLILDWRVLGYGRDEPWEDRSNTQQGIFNKEANRRAASFLAGNLCPRIQHELSAELHQQANIYTDPEDPQTVIFAYPVLFSDASTLQVIRLEIGALAAWTPSSRVLISPYAAEQYPRVFLQGATSVLTTAPERTFWEKAAILHHEANRPEHLLMPHRYARHYYDLSCMADSSVKNRAFAQPDLLQRVVDFSMRFYPRSWAHYSEAIPAAIRLSPPSYRLRELRTDYMAMRNMIYGDVPSLDSILDRIVILEEEIHHL